VGGLKVGGLKVGGLKDRLIWIALYPSPFDRKTNEDNRARCGGRCIAPRVRDSIFAEHQRPQVAAFMECVDFMQPRWPSRTSTFNFDFLCHEGGTTDSVGLSSCSEARTDAKRPCQPRFFE
jgi:hypothetical protein